MDTLQQSSDLKALVLALRTMPVVAPPCGLSRQIMATLPRSRGWLGRLECVLRSAGFRRARGRARSLILPDTPMDLGLCLLSAGVFFMCLAITVLVGLPLVGIPLADFPASLTSAAFFLAPTLVGAGLILLAGWFQFKTPDKIIPQGFRLITAGTLFGLTMMLGLSASIHQLLSWPVTWIGISGVVVVAGLAVIPKLLFTNPEVRHDKIVCSI